MRHSVLAVVITAMVIVASGTTAHAQKDVKDAIMEANERFESLYATGDPVAFVEGMYTEDARLLPPNSPMVTGKDNLVAMWGGMMAAGVTPKVKTTSALAYGKTAIEEGTVDIYAGDQKVDEVKFLVIWKKVKGEWLMHQDIWNSSMPAGDH